MTDVYIGTPHGSSPPAPTPFRHATGRPAVLPASGPPILSSAWVRGLLSRGLLLALSQHQEFQAGLRSKSIVYEIRGIRIIYPRARGRPAGARGRVGRAAAAVQVAVAQSSGAAGETSSWQLAAGAEATVPPA